MRSDWYGAQCFSFESKRVGGRMSPNYDDTNTVRMLRTETRTCTDGRMDMEGCGDFRRSVTINRSENSRRRRCDRWNRRTSVRDGTLEVRCGRRVAGVWCLGETTAATTVTRDRDRSLRWRRPGGSLLCGCPVCRSVSRSVRACVSVHARGKKLLETPGRRRFVAYLYLKTTTMKSAAYSKFCILLEVLYEISFEKNI